MEVIICADTAMHNVVADVGGWVGHSSCPWSLLPCVEAELLVGGLDTAVVLGHCHLVSKRSWKPVNRKTSGKNYMLRELVLAHVKLYTQCFVTGLYLQCHLVNPFRVHRFIQR